MLFDGDCGFCRLWIERWRRRTAGRVDYAPAQQEAGRFPEIPAETFSGSVVLVATDGEVFEGAEAVLRALAAAPGGGRSLRLYRSLPGAAALLDAAYRIVAGHRTFFSRAARLLWGGEAGRSTYRIARCLILRLLGAVYLAAFLSLWVQVDGLLGGDGILPARELLDSVRRQTGADRYWSLPTWLWLGAGDASLHVVCGAGVLMSLLILAGVAPLPCLALAWTCYLSLATVGRVFLRFQWDSLLLEAGFLAIFLAPARARCRIACPSHPSRAALALVKWLLFRVMFSSGVVKLASGDPTWWDLRALDYHYWTQPLPAWTSWYAAHLPAWAQTASTLGMFLAELGAPLLIVAPRRPRHLACAILLGLQAGIALTGNYGFFNLLGAALCVALLDDGFWPRRLRARALAAGAPLPAAPPASGRRRAVAWVGLPLAGVLFLLGMTRLVGSFRVSVDWPAPLEWADDLIAPFSIVNGYGLFARMTTERPEIVVEGSDDGGEWRPYEFRYKPGDPARPPGFVGLHMPRLDWQMWFAALGSYRTTPWFGRLAERLLQGSPPVLRLLGRNPFPDAPPRYLRAVLYHYRFTDPDERRREGTWWTRSREGLYCPAVSLQGGPGR